MARSPGEIYDEKQAEKAIHIETLNLANTEVVEKVLREFQASLAAQAMLIKGLENAVANCLNRTAHVEGILLKAHAASMGHGPTSKEQKVAISVDFVTGIITVPKADLVLVDGINYTMNVDTYFFPECKIAEATSEGMMYTAIINISCHLVYICNCRY